MSISTIKTDHIRPFISSILKDPSNEAVTRVAIVARALKGDPQEYVQDAKPFMTPLQKNLISSEITDFLIKGVLPTVSNCSRISFFLAMLHADGSKSCREYTVFVN